VEIRWDNGSSPADTSAIAARALGYTVLLATASGSSASSGSGPLENWVGGPGRVRRWARSDSAEERVAKGCLEQSRGGVGISLRIAGDGGRRVGFRVAAGCLKGHRGV
jgi:hypothetical protein